MAAMASEKETSRKRVQTYVPAYQKDTWERHADALDMSLSEFVRSMVQAGRKGFDPEARNEGSPEPATGPSSTPEPQGSGLEEQVLSTLSREAYVDWDELLAGVTDEVEDRLDTTLQELQDEGTVRYSGRHGGYVLE
jgi:hypothetical protein